MGILRFVYRFILFWIWTAIMAIYGIILGGRSWPAIKRLTIAAKIWTSGIAKILGLHIKVFGDTSKCNGLIISNHMSYVDVFLLGAIFPLRYTPRSDIKYWPVLGQALWVSRPIWINRSTKQSAGQALDEITESLRNKINIIAFPEGTTGSGEGDLLPFKSTVFEAAVEEDVPVHPVLIHYKNDENIRISWYGNDTLFGHAWNLLKAKKIEAEVHILPAIYANGKNRKELAKNAYIVMNSRYRELYG